MDKTAIRNFAIWARKKLIEDTEKEAALYGITEKGIETPLNSGKDQYFNVPGRARTVVISGETIHQRERLARRITKAAEGRDYKDGYHAVMEEIAYTWFNRLIAIRFMEVNDYLPGHIRPLSSVTEGKVEPDLMTWPENSRLPFTDDEMRRIRQMKNGNDSDALFGMLFLKVCNQLHTLLPRLFEKTDDDTELLLRLPVMDREGVVYRLAHDIPEEDWKEQVQIVGWMYQYYNSEPKKDVFDGLKKNKKITKDTIAPATQLFTPDWIVRYMVENSLGRLWLEGHPDEALQAKWKYYIPEAKQDEAVEEKLHALREERKKLNPEDLTFLDPCMGSGHILAYAFDLLMDIYRASGRDDRSAVESIITHNLYGLEIDERAAQLAYFEVMMKGREYDRRFFRSHLEPHTCVITESNGLDTSLVDAVFEKEKNLKKDMVSIMEDMKDGKTYGSLIHVRKVDFEGLKKYLQQELDSGSFYGEVIKKEMLPLVECAEILGDRKSCCNTNPPYMGSSNMNTKLSSYVKKNYADAKADLFACFMERCHDFTKKDGYQAMITQHAWMFLSSFEKLRIRLLSNDTIINMAHLGARAFEEIGGEVVQTTAFVLQPSLYSDYKGTYARLVEPTSQQGKEDMFLGCQHQYLINQSQFDKIPGNPIAYWFKDFSIFDYPRLGSIIDARIGMVSGNNPRFMRYWSEVAINNIEFGASPLYDPQKCKWYPLQKGGDFRLWYGNLSYVINWWHDGYELKYNNFIGNRVRAHNFNGNQQFKEGISWNSVTSGRFSCRYTPKGFTFDAAGPLCEVKKSDVLFSTLAFLSSKVTSYLFALINPTINFPPGYLECLPLIVPQNLDKVNSLVRENISISKDDWDAFETSWDFQRHPLMRPVGTVEEAFSRWKEECEDRFQRLKANEEELNRIFIHIYGLEDELTPEGEDKDVTVRKADLGRDIRSLISYGVGCILGRYSLDTPGLAYAGGEWDSTKYKTFCPDEDNIIPITDEAYFDDDMVGRFTDWLSAVYGKDTLQENLKFMAEALGKKGDSPREALRKYFLTDFFKDHCKTYQKRPIYWLFDSGKKNGFKALIYLHRYDKDTMSRMRNRYLHRMEKIYQQRIEECRNTIAADPSSPAAVKAKKEQEKFTAQLLECQAYDEKLGHLALSYITLDLDDGVKVNYEKAQTDREGKKYPILAAIK